MKRLLEGVMKNLHLSFFGGSVSVIPRPPFYTSAVQFSGRGCTAVMNREKADAADMYMFIVVGNYKYSKKMQKYVACPLATVT